MQRMSLKKYAQTHKISIFQTIKKVRSGELKSETVQENGKEVVYILYDDENTKAKNDDTKPSNEASLHKRVEALEEEVRILRRELDGLKMSLGLKGG